MKRYKSLAMILGILLLSVSAAFAGEMQPRIASFDFFMDHSGSMMMKHDSMKQPKMDIAKETVNKVISKVPNLGYKSSVHTFAPYTERSALGTFSKAKMKEAVSGIATVKEIRGRYTPMGDGLASLDDAVTPMPRKGAVILVSDGLSNMGSDPVAQATALYNNTNGICLHVISLADSPEGKETLKAISKLNGCSVYADADTLLANEAKLDAFVKDVFYYEGMEEKTMPASSVAEEEVIVLRNVNFAFDSAELTDDSKVILDEAAMLLEDRKDTIVMTGHTDSTGPEGYNMALSKRRADSVRAYFLQKGLNANQLVARGKGETQPEATNSTSEGRRINRRVVISFE